METNIFQIQDQSSWNCKVRHLSPGHGALVIEMINHEIGKVMKLEFHFVEYFDGWTSWKGADFRIATDLEHMALLRKDLTRDYRSNEDLLEVVLLGPSRLFICDSHARGSIQILATGGTLFDRDGNKIITRSILDRES